MSQNSQEKPLSGNTCRFCGHHLHHTFADLGVSPLANSYVPRERAQQAEAHYPLCAYVCDECLLVQLPVYESAEQIFSDYTYFSSYSDSWLDHCRRYAEMMIERFGFGRSNRVIEIASNDGYLLQYFKKRGIPVLGIEPAANVAEVAQNKGIETVVTFFGSHAAKDMSARNIQADLLIGNNVLAHVPGINDFVKGLKMILKPQGIITMEFPHLMKLIEENQFDTIYHEHFSYFSMFAVKKIFEAHGLDIFDVDEIPTHGGSLRIYARHLEGDDPDDQNRVHELIAKEKQAGLHQLESYSSFHQKILESKRSILSFMIQAKQEGKSLVGYGAPAKGNTLLNYCGIGADFIDYTVDRNPHKQGCFLPGSRIPIYPPERVKETTPDYLIILPWNLREEIMSQMSHVRQWGGKFVTLIPEVDVF